MVFEPSAAPRGREEFIAWFNAQTQWSEPHGYNDPSVASPALRSWYAAITREFPNLNAPGVDDDDVTDRMTDYSIGRDVIYAAFAWSEAEAAYETVRPLAIEHGVGFYDVSGDEGEGEILFPGAALAPASQGVWRKIAAAFGNRAGE